MTQERLTALEDVAALATIGATYPELMLYLQAEMAKCEQALAAQPEQEPVADDKVICPACCHQFRAIPTTVQTLMLNAGFEPPFTTPPAAQWDKPAASFNDWWNGDYDDSANPFEEDSAAYWAWAGWTAAQRQWVGLTDEEVKHEWEVWRASLPRYIGFAQGIEAKLKERNT